MRCPHCLREGGPVQGRCAWCGYTLALIKNPSQALHTTPVRSTPSGPLSQGYQLMRGDLLQDGRYRLVKLIDLPENQRQQGAAWSALDTLASHRHVLIREIQVLENMVRVSSIERIASVVIERFKALGKYPGFPKVMDSFTEKGALFLVLSSPEGETLASLLKQQGGALPEEQVAAYGYQLCTLLALLADQQPPIVHGSITPETIILSEDQQSISLTYLPLFRPEQRVSSSEQVPAGYAAPEQVRGGEITPSSDLYAVAVIMHHAVTGYDPRTRLAQFHPPARRLNAAVTPQMELILARQLSLLPSKRYEHPSEMQRDLALLLKSYPDPITSEHPVQVFNPLRLSSAQLREQSRSTMLLNMGVFAAICAVLLIGLILIFLRF